MFFLLASLLLLYVDTYLVTDPLVRLGLGLLSIVMVGIFVYLIFKAQAWKRSYPHVPWWVHDAPIDDPDGKKADTKRK